MVDQSLNKKEIVKLVDAQAKSVDSISERLVKVEELIEKQDSRSFNIIISVLVAFIFIVGTVAVEVILSNKKDKQFYSGLIDKINEQNLKIIILENKVDNLKARNTYLK